MLRLKVKQTLLIGLLSGVLFLLGVIPAEAHAVLVGSEPSERAIVADPPRLIRLFLSEPVDPDFFGVEVYDETGQRVDLGNPHVSSSDPRTVEVGVRELPTGTYVVVWHVVSLDTHPVRDSFPFSVGAGVVPKPISLDLPAVGAPPAVDTLVRWLTDLDVLILIGGLAFPVLMLQRTAEGARTWLWFAWAADASLLAVAFVSLASQAASAAGLPLANVLSSHAISRTLDSRFGVLLIVRELLGLALAGVLAAIGSTAAGRTRAAWIVGVALSAGIALTIAAGGHAATADKPVVDVIFDWLHLLAGGAWLGGLIQVVVVLRSRRDADTLARFSRFAIVTTAVVVATGAWNTLQLVAPAGWQAFSDTAYGAVLSGKLVLLIPIFALAGANWLLVQRGRSQVVLRLTMGEVVLLVIIIGVTAILVGQPPSIAIPLAARPFVDTRQGDSGSVTFSVTPNQAGDNRINVSVADTAGRPMLDPQLRVHVGLTMLEMEMGTRQVDLQGDGRGNFSLAGGYLSMPGRWRADVQVSHGETRTLQDQFTVLVGQAPGVSRPAFSPAYILYLAVTDPDRPQNAAPVNPLFVATVSSLLALLVARGLWGRQLLAARAVLALGLAGTLVFGGVSIAQAYRKSLPNPIPADSASLDRGRAVYARCIACHGVAGRGDGPAGRTLNPRPADFRVHMAAGHTDRQLFDWISRGIDGTAMPAFGDQLSEQDRWDVINYIRTFAAQ